MTDRDTFAAAALTGILVRWQSRIPSDIGEVAYKCADAMLRERRIASCDTPTLTDEEREAIRTAERGYFAWKDDNGEGYWPERIAVTETLRKMLERLK